MNTTSLNNAKSTAGTVALSSRITSSSKTTIEMNMIALISPDANQSLRFPSSRTYCMVPTPTISRPMPAQSRCWRWRSAIECIAARTSSGSCTKRETIRSETAPTGMLM